MASRYFNKWRARVKHNYVERFLGLYETKEEAEEAERRKRIELTGRPDTVPGWVKGRR